MKMCRVGLCNILLTCDHRGGVTFEYVNPVFAKLHMARPVVKGIVQYCKCEAVPYS